MIPSYVPETKKTTWSSVYNQFGGGDQGKIAANIWLTRRIEKEKMEKVVRDVVRFDIDKSSQLITRSENGDEYVSFKLVEGVDPLLGVAIPEFVLRTWESVINSGKAIVGDKDHEEYDRLLKAGYTDEQIKELLRKKPGIAKSVKAIFKDGALWVKALIDKRYRRLIESSKGVSLEAIVDRDDNGNVVGGDLLGFTFAVNQEPVYGGTEVSFT